MKINDEIEMTREEAIGALREIKEMAEKYQAQRSAGFLRWPDLDDLFGYIEKHGIPAPEASKEGE